MDSNDEDSLIKQQLQKEYYHNYYLKNKAKFQQHFLCMICGGRYHYSNKSRHIKRKKHMDALTNAKDYFLNPSLRDE